MLSSGDFALAYPGSTILYHGVRMQGDIPLTAEVTSLLAQRLRTSDDSYAMELAHRTELRFMFRFMTSKEEFSSIRQENPKLISDLDCFLALISGKLSGSARQVLENAQNRHGRYNALLDSVLRKKIPNSKSVAAFEAFRIKAIVDFELRNNKKNEDWSFQADGLQSLTDDFFLLNEYLSLLGNERFQKLCARYGSFLLDEKELAEIHKLPKAERAAKTEQKVRPQLRPVWSFFVALCHALQQGENDLTATDAFWLGLLDEVIGIRELPSRRYIMEYEPDVEKSPSKLQKKQKP